MTITVLVPSFFLFMDPAACYTGILTEHYLTDLILMVFDKKACGVVDRVVSALSQPTISLLAAVITPLRTLQAHQVLVFSCY